MNNKLRAAGAYIRRQTAIVYPLQYLQGKRRAVARDGEGEFDSHSLPDRAHGALLHHKSALYFI
jgi:hypothetical protein